MRGTRNADRLRPRSVRAKIVSLLMLPIVSLMALWGFAAVNTASNIGDLQRLKEVNSQLLTPSTRSPPLCRPSAPRQCGAKARS